MRFVCFVEPKSTIPTAERQSAIESTVSWYETEKDNLELFGTFPGGGCFCVVDCDNAEELHRITSTIPLAPYADIQALPFVEGSAGLEQLRDAISATTAGRDR